MVTLEIFLSLQEISNSMFSNSPYVPDGSIPVDGLQEVRFSTSLKITALPATHKIFLSAASSDLTPRVATPITATSFTSQANHSTQDFVTFFVIPEIFKVLGK